jgi:hypothetical protein
MFGKMLHLLLVGSLCTIAASSDSDGSMLYASMAGENPASGDSYKEKPQQQLEAWNRTMQQTFDSFIPDNYNSIPDRVVRIRATEGITKQDDPISYEKDYGSLGAMKPSSSSPASLEGTEEQQLKHPLTARIQPTKDVASETKEEPYEDYFHKYVPMQAQPSEQRESQQDAFPFEAKMEDYMSPGNYSGPSSYSSFVPQNNYFLARQEQVGVGSAASPIQLVNSSTISLSSGGLLSPAISLYVKSHGAEMTSLLFMATFCGGAIVAIRIVDFFRTKHASIQVPEPLG